MQVCLTHLILEIFIKVHITLKSILMLILSRNLIDAWHGFVNYQQLLMLFTLSMQKEFLKPAFSISFLSWELKNMNTFSLFDIFSKKDEISPLQISLLHWLQLCLWTTYWLLIRMLECHLNLTSQHLILLVLLNTFDWSALENH